jgi:hypothetical protein
MVPEAPTDFETQAYVAESLPRCAPRQYRWHSVPYSHVKARESGRIHRRNIGCRWRWIFLPAADAVEGVSDAMTSESGVTAATKAVVMVFMIEAGPRRLCRVRLAPTKPACHANFLIRPQNRFERSRKYS